MEGDTIGLLNECPIFPLGTVLFPGAILPLHIFEERYKAMMQYAVEHSGQFGLSYTREAAVARETLPKIGSVGCAAKINAVMPLDEGRMNILSTGLARYRIVEFTSTSPFLIARIEAFADDPQPEADFARLLADARLIAQQFLDALQSLNDSDSASALEFPEDAEAFSLLAASLLPVDNDIKQNLLEMTSTGLRLTRVRHYLINSLAQFNQRLRLHEQAKGNGHATKKS